MWNFRPNYIDRSIYNLRPRDPKSEKFVAIPIDFLLKKLKLHDCIIAIKLIFKSTDIDIIDAMAYLINIFK